MMIMINTTTYMSSLGFLYNVLNNGWTIKKNKNEYIFIKKSRR